MTIQRQIILDVMRKGQSHMNAQEIYDMARKECPSIAMGTVYRNLKLLADSGEIMHIPVKDGPDRYDINPVPHEHLICQRCGKLQDVQLPGLLAYLRKSTGCQVTHCTLSLEGVCLECESLPQTGQ